MIVFTKVGSFSPTVLQKLLAAAGVDVLGVTNDATSVQIICQDGTAQSNIDAVVAAYPNPVAPNDLATKNLIAAVTAVVTASDFAHAQNNLRVLVSPIAVTA